MQRRWTASFLLDANKLTRIQDILTARLTRNQSSPVFKCDVMFKNGTTDTFQTIGDVLALDNTERNPITALTVSAHTPAGNASPADCTIEFMGDTKLIGSGAARRTIALHVDGQDQTARSEIFAAVEEQIERTLVSPWPQVGVAVMLLVVLFFALVWQGAFRVPVLPGGLSSSDLLQLDDLSSAAKNADDKLNFLYEAKRREIHSLADKYRPIHIEQVLTVSGIVTTVVFVGLVGMLIYMLGFCYPMNRFLWGDYGARYAILKERGKLIRNIIGVALILGIIVNLVSAEIWQHYQSNRPEKLIRKPADEAKVP